MLLDVECSKDELHAKAVFDMHYAVTDEDGEWVAEFGSYDKVIDWANSHLEEYPNNKIICVWELMRAGHMLYQHYAPLECNYTKEEEKFLKECRTQKGVAPLIKDCADIEEVYFTGDWY